MKQTTCTQDRVTITSDFGTFEGFNFRDDQAIDRVLTATDVVNWDHDEQGEAEFWPSGDHSGVGLVFKKSGTVVRSQLLALDQVLRQLGEDSIENFLRIHFAVNVVGIELCQLTLIEIEDQQLHSYLGTSFIDLRRQAAFELLEMYFPAAYQLWRDCDCDGFVFNSEEFVRSNGFTTEEVELAGGAKAFLVGLE